MTCVLKRLFSFLMILHLLLCNSFKLLVFVTSFRAVIALFLVLHRAYRILYIIVFKLVFVYCLEIYAYISLI